MCTNSQNPCTAIRGRNRGPEHEWARGEREGAFYLKAGASWPEEKKRRRREEECPFSPPARKTDKFHFTRYVESLRRQSTRTRSKRPHFTRRLQSQPTNPRYKTRLQRHTTWTAYTTTLPGCTPEPHYMTVLSSFVTASSGHSNYLSRNKTRRGDYTKGLRFAILKLEAGTVVYSG